MKKKKAVPRTKKTPSKKQYQKPLLQQVVFKSPQTGFARPNHDIIGV